MHGCGVYERWTNIQLARAIDEQQFCERDAVWLSMEGEGAPGQLRRLPLLLPHSGYWLVANVKYMQVGVGHYDLPLPVWSGVGLGAALWAYGKPRM